MYYFKLFETEIHYLYQLKSQEKFQKWSGEIIEKIIILKVIHNYIKLPCFKNIRSLFFKILFILPFFNSNKSAGSYIAFETEASIIKILKCSIA